MTDSLENLTVEISNVYAAKNIARYLEFKEPEPVKIRGIFFWKMTYWLSHAIYDCVENLHTAYLFLTNKKEYFEKKEYTYHTEQTRQEMQERRQKDNEEYNNFLETNGLLTPEEKISYEIVRYSGDDLASRVHHSNKRFDPEIKIIELMNKNKENVQKISISQDKLNNYLLQTITGNTGTETYHHVNPDFVEKAVNWLKEEINGKLNQGKEVKLLERVLLKKDSEGKIEMTFLRDPRYETSVSKDREVKS